MKFYGFVIYRNMMHLVDGAFNTPQEAIDRARTHDIANLPGAMANSRGSVEGPGAVIDVITGDHWLETGKTMTVQRAA